MDSPLTYQDYLQYKQQTTGGDGDGGTGAISQQQWDALSPTEKWNNLQGGFVLAPGDPRYDAMAKDLGGEPNRLIFVVGNPDPSKLNSQYLNDPSKLVKGNDWVAFKEDNRTPFAQKQDNASGLNDMGWALSVIGTFAGGMALAGAAGGAAGAAGGAASETGGAAAATGAFDATGVTPSLYGTAVEPAAGASGAVGTAGVQAAPFEAGYPGNAPIDAGATPPSAPTPTSTPNFSDPNVAPGTQAPAPVSNATPPAGTQALAPVTDVSTPPPSAGNPIIDGARSAYNGASSWYSQLSPAGRLVVGQAVSQGFRGAMGAAAQSAAHQAAVDAEERARQDRIRRGSVQPVGANPYSPKPKGIIDSSRTGG